MSRVLNLALLLLSTIAALALCETALRVFYPHAGFGGGSELVWFRKSGKDQVLVVPDSKLGFRPKLGTNVYDSRGILRESTTSTASTGAGRRILFLGDSVTARARIVQAIQALLEDPLTAVLNGGVESFNLNQEVEFFFQYQAELPFDHIIHQLHANDLQSTPIAFKDRSGAINVYALNVPRLHVSSWLFQNSYLYRLALPVLVSRIAKPNTLEDARENLKRMATFAASRGIPYDVVLFPILSPYSAWSPQERTDWKTLMTACHELARCVSLMPVMDEMLAAGKAVEETPGDNWHPNDAFASRAARLIVQSLSLARMPNR
jgi:hypothetical protein